MEERRNGMAGLLGLVDLVGVVQGAGLEAVAPGSQVSASTMSLEFLLKTIRADKSMLLVR